MEPKNKTDLEEGDGDSISSAVPCCHLIHKAYRFRLYPNKGQKELLAKHFGCCRYAYNHFLQLHNEMNEISGVSPSLYDMHRLVAEMRRDEGTEWLSEVYSHALQAELRHLDAAVKRFYRAIREGKAEPIIRDGKPTGRRKYEPRFKSKRDGIQSVTFPDNVKVRDGKLVLPKFKTPMAMKMHRPLGGRACQATVSRDSRGKYYVSILCEEEASVLPEAPRKSIGIDLGVKEMAVCSSGERVSNPKFLEKGEKRQKFLQRQVSRKKKGSSNRRRAKKALSRHHEKVANRRRDYTNKFTMRIVRENQAICVEDLNVKGMVSNHHLAKSISSVAFGEITRQLEYKSGWYGRGFVKVGRWYPSSKTCSYCGHINHGLTLKDREWTCANCGAEIDRDYNAALNIEAEGLRILSGMGAMSDVKQKGGEAAA